MPNTIGSAFDRKHIDDVFQFISEYRFQVGELEPAVTIRLYRPLSKPEMVVFRQSHFISTPAQGAPYRTSTSWNDSEELAINQVVRTMSEYYNDAITAGHKPNEKWLTVNPNFNL